ncbi:MAG: trans-2-enoyl-CoA reductase family protein [Lachnospiraceae bacterium]|nr:trans-2-enoyl-CoA reductase family protein [Lachnospiraceae bacterium]
MIVTPKSRGFICATAHPEGCKADVKNQIEYMKSHPKTEGVKNALIIGASMGYGLSSRIACAYSANAATLGVIFDKPAKGEKRTATAGWYNTAAFEEFAHADNLYAKTINGDAFSEEVKKKAIETIKNDLGQVDLVVYSIAAPRRTTADGTTYNSVLKTVGEPYTNHTIDLRTNAITDVTIEPANDEEIEATVKVMGGEDWEDWIKALSEAGVLADNATTVAYSYIGPSLTHAMYKEGSIGQAKKHLYKTADEMNGKFNGLRALVSINKSVVTQASAAIPVLPLYIALVFKVMKEKGLHEDTCEQIYRMMHDRIYAPDGPITDENRFIRVDDYEMQPEIQAKISELWDEATTENVKELGDIDGYWDAFFKIFGFGIDGVDYDKDIDIHVEIPDLIEMV